MFSRKPHVVVAITTFDLDALRVSLPPIRKMGGKFTLVIHNDNPNKNLTRRMVRKMHPRGKIYIINEDKNYGELESRIRTIEFIRDNNISCEWIMFIDDDDVLIDFGVPNVDNNSFAIVQNATTVSDSVTDILKISANWARGTVAGQTGPHFDINGTLVRTNVLFEFAEFMRTVMPYTAKIILQTRYRVPISTLLWAGLNTFVRARHPEMSPIYMNRTNCVLIKMGHAKTKYGKTVPRGTVAHRTITNIIKQFTTMVESTAMQNMVAENQ